MAQVIIPDVALREPNLLIPGKKPVGAVKIDWSHPISTDLVGVFLLDSERIHNYATNSVNGIISPTYPPTLVTGTEGRVMNFTASSTFTDGDIIYPYNESGPPSNSDDFSFAVCSKTSVAVPAGRYPYVVCGRDSDEVRFIISSDGDNSGKLYFGVWASVTASTIQTSAEIDDQKWHRYVCTYSDSGNRKATVHINNTTYTSSTAASGTITAYAGDNGGIYIGGRATTYDRSWRGDVSYVFMWRRQITQAEALSINADPYQFLIPA